MATLDTAEIGKALIGKKWLALVVVGLIVIIFAACGGVSVFQLHDFGWRFFVTVIGILVCAVGVWGNIAARDEDDPDLTKDYGMKITGPGDNANVGDEFTLEGTYEEKPPNIVPIRAFICSPSTGNYWPTSHKVQFFDERKRWAVQLRPGGSKGDVKVAGIALLGKNAQVVCKHYDAVAKDIFALRKKFDAHIGLSGIPEMPADWKELKTIRITRV